MSHDQHALLAIVLEDAPEPQDDVAPAFAGGGPEVELAELLTHNGQLGMALLDAQSRQPAEDAEFFFPQPLVDDEYG
jgi:hypothetical protein